MPWKLVLGDRDISVLGLRGLVGVLLCHWRPFMFFLLQQLLLGIVGFCGQGKAWDICFLGLILEKGTFSLNFD